jgi:hypothetical protein
MNTSSCIPRLKPGALILLACLASVLVMAGVTDFFPDSFTASASTREARTEATSPTNARTTRNNNAIEDSFWFTGNNSQFAINVADWLANGLTAAPPPRLGNYPDASLPLSTNTTVTPDAAPADATSITVSAPTYFKGKLEGDPVTGVVRVTDAHPAGTFTVTVRAFGDGGAAITTAFQLTVTTPATCTPVSFAAAANFGAGTNPQSVAVGDFNGDSQQDLAVANVSSNDVSILLGDGAGSFSSPTSFDAGSSPLSIAIGDFDGDGNQDLATANEGTADVSILLGDGASGFGTATNFGADGNPASVAIGDFDGDGRQDLAVANFASNNVSILLGDGAGGFSTATNFDIGAGSAPLSVAVGDFNGDGRQDLAVAAGPVGYVSILLGDGAGGFSTATNFGTGGAPISLAVGDFNSDGQQDIITNNDGSNNVSILLGDGAGGFSTATNFGAGGSPQSLVVGDFNGDGRQDLATTNINSADVSVLLGDGAGNFGTATNFGAGTDTSSIAIGDFDGDGKEDLAAANLTLNNVSILLRDCALTPTPTPATFTLSASPDSVTGTKPSVATVTLAQPAPFKGAKVLLSSSDTSAATVPTSITVTAGAATKTFKVATKAVPSPKDVLITATYQGQSAQAHLAVLPPTLTSLVLRPATIIYPCQSSTGTVRLSAKAPAGGVVVNLMNTNLGAQVPSSVPVPEGTTSATFSISPLSVSGKSTGAVTALPADSNFGAMAFTKPLMVLPNRPTSLTMPTSVTGPATVTATVSVACPAPAGGQVLAVSTNKASVAQPVDDSGNAITSVIIPEGQTQATFKVSAADLSAAKTVTIKATFSGLSKSVTMTVN